MKHLIQSMKDHAARQAKGVTQLSCWCDKEDKARWCKAAENDPTCGKLSDWVSKVLNREIERLKAEGQKP